LRSLATQSVRPDEVIVVNAGQSSPLDSRSTDELAPAFPVQCLNTAPGLTRQRNIGIRASTGDLLFFFDDDVVLDPDYLRHAVAVYANDLSGRISAVCGHVLLPPPPRRSPGDMMRAVVQSLFLLDGLGDGRLKLSGFATFPHRLESGRAIECLSGCCMSSRRAVFARTQFDEALSSYSFMEDIDIAASVCRQGYAIYYEPAARLEHRESVGGRETREDVSRMLVRNYDYLFRKHWNTGFLRRLAFRWALLGLLMKGLVPRKNPARLRGTWAGLRDLRRGEHLQPAGLRLVYVTEHLPFGSGEPFIVPEINALLAAGHRLLILPLMDRGEPTHPDAARLRGWARRIPLRSPAFLFGVLGAMLRQPRACWRILRRYRGGNLKAALKGLYAAGLVRGQADHVHAHWADYTATMAQTISELTGVSWSFTAHRYDIVANNRLAEKLRSASFARFIARDGLRLARQSVTEEDLANASVIHLGVQVPATPAGPSERPVILCPAGLLPVKGHRYLIEAIGLLRDRGLPAELLLAGEGELREDITAQVAALELADRVTLLGAVPHNALLAMYAERRVMLTVLPSVDLGGGLHEGIPASLMEAMSYGVPVVGTLTGGIPELLGAGAGLLVPPADSPALADALARLLEQPDLRRDLGARGRTRIEEDFNVFRAAEQLAEEFKHTIR